jgi:serpin B
MRSSTLASFLIGLCLSGAGCGASSTSGLGQENDNQDAAPANDQDAAVNATDLATGANADAVSNPGPLAVSPAARATADPSGTEQTALATSLSGFAFALLQELRRDQSTQGNFVFSPASISLALGMVYAGAVGTTASQMKDAMQVTASSDAYLRSLNWLDQQLASRAAAALKQTQDLITRTGSTASAPDPANYRLHVVNSYWGERTSIFEQPYLDTLATNFGAGIRLADFKTQPEAERLAINAWVSQETLNRINDLLMPGSIDSSTRAVLVNAVHLKLPWYNPFLAGSTVRGTFTKVDGSTVSVPLMQKNGPSSYAEDDTTQAIAISLAGQLVEFVVFLPKPTSSLAQFEDSLSQAHAQTLVASMSSQTVNLGLPKFVFTTQPTRLRNDLMALGMTDAFGASADFTGITKQKPLFIGDVVHKAMVGIDENGVEAAAATAVRAGSAALVTPKEMTVNRPFFFGIYDHPTSTWLFLGHVTDPSS